MKSAEEKHSFDMQKQASVHSLRVESMKMEALEMKLLLEKETKQARKALEDESSKALERQESIGEILEREEEELKRQVLRANEEVEQLRSRLETARSRRELNEYHIQEIQRKQKRDKEMGDVNSFFDWLSSGVVLTKHPRSGKPHPRVCWISPVQSSSISQSSTKVVAPPPRVNDFRFNVGKSVSKRTSITGMNQE